VTEPRGYAILLVVSEIVLIVGMKMKVPSSEVDRSGHIVSRNGKIGGLLVGVFGILAVVRYLLLL
jgi:hypothetical protein